MLHMMYRKVSTEQHQSEEDAGVEEASLEAGREEKEVEWWPTRTLQNYRTEKVETVLVLLPAFWEIFQSYRNPCRLK